MVCTRRWKQMYTLNFVEVSVSFSGCDCNEIRSCHLPLESCRPGLRLTNCHDLLGLNKLMREAKSTPDLCWWIVSLPSSFVWLTAADAAWANRPDGSVHEWSCDHGGASEHPAHRDSRDSAEQPCSRKMSDESCGLGTARWTCDESGGSVHSCQKPWMQSTSRADRTDLPQCQIGQSGAQNWKNPGDPPLWRWSCGTKDHDLFWLMLQHIRGGRVVLTFPWKLERVDNLANTVSAH